MKHHKMSLSLFLLVSCYVVCAMDDTIESIYGKIAVEAKYIINHGSFDDKVKFLKQNEMNYNLASQCVAANITVSKAEYTFGKRYEAINHQNEAIKRQEIRREKLKKMEGVDVDEYRKELKRKLYEEKKEAFEKQQKGEDLYEHEKVLAASFQRMKVRFNRNYENRKLS